MPPSLAESSPNGNGVVHCLNAKNPGAVALDVGRLARIRVHRGRRDHAAQRAHRVAKIRLSYGGGMSADAGERIVRLVLRLEQLEAGRHGVLGCGAAVATRRSAVRPAAARGFAEGLPVSTGICRAVLAADAARSGDRLCGLDGAALRVSRRDGCWMYPP